MEDTYRLLTAMGLSAYLFFVMTLIVTSISNLAT
jgi:hypothetical protein